MPDETFADRLVALKDIVPPTYRKHLSNTLSTTSSWVQTTLNYGGKTLWVVSTSVLLLGVPWALAFAEEQQMAEMEREMKMQQSANEVSFAKTCPAEGSICANGKSQLLTQQQQVKPAL
jgi:import receptor subunit TOM22